MSRHEHRATKENVAELMSLGLTAPIIAERLGVAKNRIYQIMKHIRDDLGWQAQ